MDYLSSGFSKVDSSQDPCVFTSCLQTLCSLPYFQDYKKKSFQLLDLKEGSRILEVGCGLGQDAMALARMVGDKGSVIAVDSSRRMIGAAGKGLTGGVQSGSALQMPAIFLSATAPLTQQGLIESCSTYRIREEPLQRWFEQLRTGVEWWSMSLIGVPSSSARAKRRSAAP